MSALAATAAASDGPLLRLGWDGILAGTPVQGVSERPRRVGPGASPNVYVGGASFVSPPNALVFDFADFDGTKPNAWGYHAVALPEAPSNAWTELSICFRAGSGAVSGQIRGFYDLPGQGLDGVKRAWPVVWIEFGDRFTVVAEQPLRSKRRIDVGAVVPGAWHRATVRLPPPGATNAVGTATLERMEADGAFGKAGEAPIPFGNLVLRSAASFVLTGSRRAFFLFDDLEWRTLPHTTQENTP